MAKTFDHLILIGRPASGKSEFIDFMKKISDERRSGEFHIGAFEEIDDFPWIYQKFLEDNIWETVGHPRLYSKKVGEKIYDTTDFALYDFMMVKFNVEVQKRYLSNPSFYREKTLFIEFSRGMKDGYRRAFSLLDRDVLSKAAILCTFVSFEESCRRNIARSTEKGEQGILHHMVPKKVMEGYYRDNDWPHLTGKRESGYLDIKGLRVPFVTMGNEPELKEGPELVRRYKKALDRLFGLAEKERA